VRRRLIVANVLIIAAVLLVLEFPLALIYSRHEHDALNGSIQRDAAAVSALAREIIEHPGLNDIPSLARRYSTGSGAVVVIIGPDGRELTPSGLITTDPGFPAAIARARTGGSRTGEIAGILYATQPVGFAGQSRGVVLVGRSDESIDHRVHRFWLLLGILAAGVLGVSLAVSSRLGRWVVDPLRRLEGHATRLGSGALDTRADPTAGPPEVVALAISFNDMAERLDNLVTSQRRFVADASHQLRTPLTALRLRLESLDGHRPIDVDKTRDAALEETSRLTRLVDGLLSLARAEGARQELQPVDISAVVIERKDAWAPLAAEQGIDLRVATPNQTPLRAVLVPGHLEQILDNLVDNALDASRPGGVVELRVADASTTIEVHVTDDGPGMTDAERARAFDPFWQASAGRANGGTGLGLAIAEQLARASRSSLTLDRSTTGGIDAVLRVPHGPRHPDR
jgi:signal transduction histidine kinase